MSNIKSKQTDTMKESLIYTIFSIIIPCLFILSVDSILRTLFTELAIIPDWTIYISFICNAISARLLVYLAKKRKKIDSYIRVHTLIYLPTLVILYFITRKSPELIVYLLMLFATQWFILFGIYSKFKSYFDFLGFVQQKSDWKNIREFKKNNLVLQQTDVNLKKLDSIIKSIHFILFFLVSAIIVSNFQLSKITLLICFSSILGGVIFSFALSVCLDEYNIIANGFSVTKSMKQQRLTFILLIIFIAFILVFLSIQNSHFFTPEDIINFLKWLFPKKEIPRGSSIYIEPIFREIEPLEGLMDDYNATPIFDLAAVFDLIGMILSPVLIITFILFIIKPLIQNGIKKIFKELPSLKALLKRLSLFFHLLKQSIKKIFHNIIILFQQSDKTEKTSSVYQSFSLSQKEERQSYHKKRQTNRVIKMFTKLIQWSQKQNINYHPSLAPYEYVNMIIHKHPHQKHSLETICYIFEEALFSNHIIKREKIKDYNNKIKKIIK